MLQLPPSEFTYGKYGRCEFPTWDEIKTTKNYNDWLLSQNIIGYCNSMEVEIRPRIDCMAIMFEDEDGQQGWNHIPITVWKGFINLN